MFFNFATGAFKLKRLDNLPIVKTTRTMTFVNDDRLSSVIPLHTTDSVSILKVYQRSM